MRDRYNFKVVVLMKVFNVFTLRLYKIMFIHYPGYRLLWSMDYRQRMCLKKQCALRDTVYIKLEEAWPQNGSAIRLFVI